MKFQVGEIAIVHGPTGAPGAKYNGMECEILRCNLGPGDQLSGPAFDGKPGLLSVSHVDYEIRLSDGLHAFCYERHLRKRRPPIPEEVLTIFETRDRRETA